MKVKDQRCEGEIALFSVKRRDHRNIEALIESATLVMRLK